MTSAFWRCAFGAALAVQCAALYWPRTPSVSSGLPLDKIVHVALFAVVAALGVRAGLGAKMLVGLLGAQALLSELVQWRLLPGRGGDVRDLLADAVGVVLGIALGRWWLAVSAAPRR